MKRSRYDLAIKVPGRTKPFYVVRRRVIDGGFECSCPRWVEQREECRHVTPVKAALTTVPSLPSPVDRAIRKAVATFPHYIQNEQFLIERLIKAVKEAS